ncbi:MAG TPA: amidohydrolase [Gemmatimonadaceae bacterium]|nr:amidohydrolase [Gemmatimonadaceae bacterium]
MMSFVRAFAVVFVLAASALGAQEADLIITGSRVWTGEPGAPWAEAVAVRDNRILAVGTAQAVLAHRTPRTRVVEMRDRFVAPGFIDNHTHFGQAGALLLGANLLDVADEAGLVRRVREARDRMPRGAWIVGGDWGAYEAWAQGSAGEGRAQQPSRAEFRPHRAMLDSLTPETPVLLSKWDRSAYLANGRALSLAGATCEWPGVECDAGRPTGRLSAEAAARVRRVMPPKPLEQKLAEARVALAQLREFGVTTIHDNTPPDQFEVYHELHRRGELTTRIYARPTLDKWEALRQVGIRHGMGSEWITIGGLKGFVDGIMGNSSARFYEPYLHSGERGVWRPMMNPPGNMLRLLLGADSAGHWPQVHAIGDQAIDTLLDMMETVMRTNGDRERRYRIIHTQVMRGPEVAERMARLGIIAEVQPYHAIDDMRWMEERIGERARWAYAFRTLRDAGVRLSFGSDWPGTNAAWYTANPLHGVYAAVTRQTIDGTPAGGWFPEERVDVETALRAYTVNNAWAAGEERIKGSIAAGKLADIVVLDRDPFTTPGQQLKDVRVLLTIVDGRIVHDGRSAAAATP